MTLIRPISAFITAVSAGTLQIVFSTDQDEKREPPEEGKIPCCQKIKGAREIPREGQESIWDILKKTALGLLSPSSIHASLRYSFGTLVDNLSLWLTIGLFLGALIETFFPEQILSQFGPHLGRFTVLLLATPLYICATASTPVALALMAKGMSPGTALLLLLLGPATNFSNILVLQSVLGKKAMLVNLITVTALALLFSYCTDFLYHFFSWDLSFSMDISSHERESPFRRLCALTLVTLLTKGLWQEHLRAFFKKKRPGKKSCPSSGSHEKRCP